MTDKKHILLKCPSLTCRKVLTVPATARGKTIRCRNCSATIRVPEANAASR